jgi:hypothetical protein
VEEEERTADDSKPVPDEIPATNVVQLMTQNIFQLGGILL